jgi:hypothetical protein
VSDQVVKAGLPATLPRRIFAARRSWCVGVETGYDCAAWLAGLLAAARTTGDLPDPRAWVTRLACLALLTCLAVTGCGVVAGLYRGRHQRGSLDEVAGVSIAAGLTALSAGTAGLVLIPGQRAPLQTAAGGAGIALLAMLGARYMAFAVRQRSRTPASSAVQIIVFGPAARAPSWSSS